ncbi:MAG: hypothetical protein A3E79_04800 [Burkholderiales bacterium RIFCSPHIGHO2_12_FULL_61_11]|nr:MAG: hypothetical protein A3E79_04800 [Burkholderiales bacterium RIFCSPHIGHO2_12_FULL_61_11]
MSGSSKFTDIFVTGLGGLGVSMRSSLRGGERTLGIYLTHTDLIVLLFVSAERMCRSGILRFLLTENFKHPVFSKPANRLHHDHGAQPL